MPLSQQKTIKQPAEVAGRGLFSGIASKLRFCPADQGTGIVFVRTDLPEPVRISANIANVVKRDRRTCLLSGSGVVETVEHVLAALTAYQIDNLCVQVNEKEPPVGDGSSGPFVHLIEEAGITLQEAKRRVVALKKPIHYSNGNVHLVALPSDEYRISYTLNYPNTPVIRSQYFSLPVSGENFKEQFSRCRTFALYEEISHLMEKGLIRGGSLDNAVIIKDNAILSKEGLRFPDEMVRHKILDVIGDLSLVGFPFLAHIIAICSGHETNIAFGKKILKEGV